MIQQKHRRVLAVTGRKSGLERQSHTLPLSPSPRPSPSGRGRFLAPRWASSAAFRRAHAIRSARGGATILPLPEGEGRGEGEGVVRTVWLSKTGFAFIPTIQRNRGWIGCRKWVMATPLADSVRSGWRRVRPDREATPARRT